MSDLELIAHAVRPRGELSYRSLEYNSHYRRHPGIAAAEWRRMEALKLDRDLEAASGAWLYADAGRNVEGVCATIPLDWDTRHFGIPMERLLCFRSPALGSERLGSMVDRTLHDALSRGVRHLSMECDIDDYGLLNALTSRGFEILDLKRTYCTNRLNPVPAYERLLRRVRKLAYGDLDQVWPIIEQAAFPSRFSRDDCLDPGRVSRMYRLWFEKLLEDYFAGRGNALVVLKGGGVEAVGAIGVKDLRPFGIKKTIQTGSLYASLPSAVGSYGPFLYQLTLDGLASSDLIEATISLNNSAASRVLEGMRPNYTRTVYCLRLGVGP